MNIIAWLEFELGNCNVTGQHISHYNTRTSHCLGFELGSVINIVTWTPTLKMVEILWNNAQRYGNKFVWWERERKRGIWLQFHLAVVLWIARTLMKAETAFGYYFQIHRINNLSGSSHKYVEIFIWVRIQKLYTLSRFVNDISAQLNAFSNRVRVADIQKGFS